MTFAVYLLCQTYSLYKSIFLNKLFSKVLWKIILFNREWVIVCVCMYVKYTQCYGVYVIDKASNADIVKFLFIAKRFEAKCWTTTDGTCVK